MDIKLELLEAGFSSSDEEAPAHTNTPGPAPTPHHNIHTKPENCQLPYSGKFSLGKNFAKSRCAVLRENFARFIFAHMRLGKIKFHGIINNYSFQRGSLAVSSSLEKCLAAAESPFSLAIWTSVHYLAAYKALFSPL